ncbi:MAG: DUF4139 domain-containing protein [Alphaproteobacteria bacterium]|nr:DUF4139 domain-containing protein [Alphaproteobacteria bacterium]
MKALRLALVAAPLFLAGEPMPAAFAQIPALELKRVLLSTGGVGYFELEATVEGDAELALPVRLDQVDDVLKSIVVFDDKGGVGSISLPGREPLSEAFRDLPFTQDALDSPDGLLNALRGAEVTVGGPRQTTGRILKVIAEQTQLPNDAGMTTRHRVTLIAPDGLRQFVLEEAESVRFSDPVVQRQVDQALAAIARHRVQDQRSLQIATRGTGKRTLRVGYVVGAPLWKASYRLTTPDSGTQGKGLMQGWAVLENLSGRDWKDVALTLVSGNPVTFRQQLYTAYFVRRPEVPVEVLGRVLPPPDQGSLGMGGALAKTQQEGALRPRATFAAQQAAAAPAPAPAPAMAMAREAMPMAPPPPPADLIAAESQEATTQVLFTAPAPVSVKSGDSLSLPIVSREMPIERVALYQPGVNAANPLAAVRVTNDTGAGLPPGVLTLYERGKAGANYIGDARLSPLPAGENRLLSFAVDQKVQVERDMKSREAVAQAKISRGVLTVTYRDEQTTSYRIKAPANEDRLLIVEQPRAPDWELVSPKPSDVELTRGQWRIRQALAKGGVTTLDVTTQRQRLNVVQLASLNQQSLLAYARTGGVPDNARQALERLAGMQGEVDRLDRQIKEIGTERDTIAKDQGRLRDNLKSVPTGGDLAKRYLDNLKTQEDRLDKLRLAEEDAKQKLAQARAALADAIAKLEI